jgi:hypothetical protein
MKHTKGPWNYAQLPHIEIPHLQVCDDNGECIAEVYQQHSDFPTEANARLIASAPDLLEALEGCLLTLKIQEKYALPEDKKKYSESINKAQQAINKAKGI